MSGQILNLNDAPNDPIERLAWLGGVKKAVDDELEEQWEECYFLARFSGRLQAALDLRLHGRKRVMAWTRAGNEKRGRTIKWGDGLS